MTHTLTLCTSDGPCSTAEFTPLGATVRVTITLAWYPGSPTVEVVPLVAARLRWKALMRQGWIVRV